MRLRVVAVEDEPLAWQLVGPKSDAFLPAKRLMAAVLGVAFADYRMYADAGDVWNRRRFTAVEAWFASDDTSWPFAFANICEALGLDIPSIRTSVRSGRVRPLTSATGERVAAADR